VATELEAKYTRYVIKVSRKGKILARLASSVRTRGFVE
jgi:hypothetical protein